MSKNPFKKKNFKAVNVGEWRFEWLIDEKRPERSYMHVKAESGLFELKIKSNSHVFGYLLAAAEQGLTEQLHGYIVSLYIPAMAMTQDQGLTNDIQKSIAKWMKRREAEAKTSAKSVTPEQEEADTALLNDIVSEQGMSKRDLAKKRAEDKALMREILKDKEGEE